MRRPISLVLLAVLAMAPGKPREAPDRNKSDVLDEEEENLQGTWDASILVLRKGQVPDNLHHEWFFRGGRLTISSHSPGERPVEVRATYKLDVTTWPRSLDITLAEGPQKGKTIPAVYELKGDRLVIATYIDFSTPQNKRRYRRPKGIGERAGPGSAVNTLRRFKNKLFE